MLPTPDGDTAAVLVAVHLRVLAALTSSADVATVVARSGSALLPIALNLERMTWRSVAGELAVWLQDIAAPSYPDILETRPDLLIDNLVVFGVPGTGPSDFALCTTFTVTGRRVIVTIACDGRINPTITARLQGYYEKTAQLAADSIAMVTSGDIRSAGEASRTRDWSAGPVGAPTPTVPELFARQVATTPDAIAVIDIAGQLSYAELGAHVNELAGVLRAGGAGPGSRIGVCVQRGTDLVVTLLAVWVAGASYVPLDPGSPRARLEFIAHDADLHQIVASPDTSPPPVGVPVLRPNDRGTAAGSPPAPDDAAYLMYTSGSTGLPKGVVVEHRNVANFLSAMDLAVGMSTQDRVLAITSSSFDISVLELFWPLTRGACVFVAPDGMAERLDGHRDSFAGIVSNFGPTLLQGTPSFFTAVAAKPEVLRTLRGLRTLLVGGETFPTGLANRLSTALSTVSIVNMYGPTETTIWSTMQKLGRSPMTVPIGRPIRNTIVRVVDGLGNDACLGVPGELWIAGNGVARGYFRRPQPDAERFVDRDGQRYYRTGDQVCWRSDGTLMFLGRRDRQVKINGHRVELDEIESVLSEHPMVEATAVVLDRDRNAVTAYVLPRPNDHTAIHRVEYWREFWDARHAETGEHAGWVDSYTRTAFTKDQMRDWYEAIASRLARLSPHRIVDVGAGNGRLLRHLRPGWDHYLGIDLSPTALARATSHGEGAVDFHCGDALALRELATGAADLVVLNSVIQYFPNVEYLNQVLREAVRVAGPDGAVFVGDVRDLRLLRAFHADVQLWRAPPARPAAKIMANVDLLVRREPELCVHPDLFRSLEEHTVQLERKGERDWTELSRFRYDVTILGPAHALARTDATPCHAWDGTPIADIARQGTAVTVTDIPDARLARPLTALRELTQTDSEATAWDVLRAAWAAEQMNAVDPAEAIALGAAYDLRTWVSPAASGRVGQVDVHFCESA